MVKKIDILSSRPNKTVLVLVSNVCFLLSIPIFGSLFISLPKAISDISSNAVLLLLLIFLLSQLLVNCPKRAIQSLSIKEQFVYLNGLKTPLNEVRIELNVRNEDLKIHPENNIATRYFLFPNWGNFIVFPNGVKYEVKVRKKDLVDLAGIKVEGYTSKVFFCERTVYLFKFLSDIFY